MTKNSSKKRKWSFYNLWAVVKVENQQQKNLMIN